MNPNRWGATRGRGGSCYDCHITHGDKMVNPGELLINVVVGDERLECLVCRKQRGEFAVPGGAIYEDDLIYVSHAQLWGNETSHYLGHVFVEPKRHVAELADLTAEEAQAIGLYTSKLARALMQTEGVEHVYSFVIGDGVPHVHVHVIGRYPGAPREYWGPKVDEWPEAPQGKEAEIVQVSTRLRVFLREQQG